MSSLREDSGQRLRNLNLSLRNFLFHSLDCLGNFLFHRLRCLGDFLLYRLCLLRYLFLYFLCFLCNLFPNLCGHLFLLQFFYNREILTGSAPDVNRMKPKIAFFG